MSMGNHLTSPTAKAEYVRISNTLKRLAGAKATISAAAASVQMNEHSGEILAKLDKLIIAVRALRTTKSQAAESLYKKANRGLTG